MKNDEKTAEECKIENALLDNPMYNSLASYFSTKAPGGKLGRVRFAKECSVVICKMRYGKASLYFDVYVEENGAINTMVFDFREIFDKYVAKKAVEKHESDYEEFVYKVLYQAKFNPKNVCLFSNYKGGIVDDEEKYSAFGISLAGYTNDKFNLFTPWAGVLDDVLNALDAVNGFEGKDKKNRLTRKDVDDAEVNSPLRLILLIVAGYLAIVGGLALIIINKTWLPFFKWVVGIILIIAGVIFGPCVHSAVVSDRKSYYSNSGDLMKKFHKPEKKFFTTVGD